VRAETRGPRDPPHPRRARDAARSDAAARCRSRPRRRGGVREGSHRGARRRERAEEGGGRSGGGPRSPRPPPRGPVPAPAGAATDPRAALSEFLSQRLRFLLEESGVRFDAARAVLATGWSDPLLAWRRAKALNALRGQADFLALAAAAKRVRNILSQAAEKG